MAGSLEFGLPLFGESHGLETGSNPLLFNQKISDYQYQIEDSLAALSLKIVAHTGDSN